MTKSQRHTFSLYFLANMMGYENWESRVMMHFMEVWQIDELANRGLLRIYEIDQRELNK